MISPHRRGRPSIRIHARSVDEVEGVGLQVAACGGVVVAVPVVVQAGFEEKVLAGEAQVVGRGSRNRVDLAEWPVHGVPDHGPGCIRHLDRAIEMVGVHEPELGRGGVQIGTNYACYRLAVQPMIILNVLFLLGCGDNLRDVSDPLWAIIQAIAVVR